MRASLHKLLTLLALTGALAVSCERPAPVEPEPKDTRHLNFAKDQIDVDYRETAFSVQVDANFDYKFTKYAEEHNLPISLIYATKDALTVFTDVFGK